MKYLPAEKIETNALELLKSCGVMDVPVPLDIVAHRLELNVEYASLGDDVSGLLVLDNSNATIGVNKNHPNARQRFTIAHEIGHYVLHRNASELFIDTKYSAVFRDSKSSSGEDRMEIQANMFAAALLMPRTLLEEMIQSEEIDLGDDYALASLAEKFGVSLQALAYRLSSLEFFDRRQISSAK